MSNNNGNNFLFTGQGVASNAPAPEDTEVISLQKINANLYALVNGPGSSSGVTSFNTRTGAVTLLAGDIPNNAANTSGGAGSVALANITGAGTGVLAAGANAVNTAGGIPTLNTSGYLNPSSLLTLPERIFQPTTTNAGVTTVAPFNVVCIGDSIVEGGGASIPYNVYANAPALPSSTAWPQSLQNSGFVTAQGTVWPLGMGGQVTQNALAQFFSSAGQTASVALTNGSTSGTLNATPQFIVSGAVVTGTGIPSNTTMTNTQVVTTMTALSQGSPTITVTNGSSVVNGMYVAILSTNGFLLNAAFGTNATVLSGGGTNTLTLSTNCTGGNAYTGINITVVFFSPTVTLSSAYTGTTGTQALTSGGTLITSTATFTANSTTATVTGTTVGLTGTTPMGVGGLSIVPGSTATFSGTTMTLSAAAKASGSSTFYASCATHDLAAAANTTFYPSGINTTPYLLSPNVTGVPAYLLICYGINDSNTINNVPVNTWMTNYYAPLVADAIAAGYTVCYLTIPPPAANNSFSGSPSGVAAYNALLQSRPAALTGAFLIDIAAQFPTGNPNIGDIYHASDGLHPSDTGHRLIAGCVNDFLFALFATASNIVTYPLGNGGINEYWLPPQVVKTDRPNVIGTPPVSGGTNGTLLAQQIVGSLLVSGDSATTPGTLIISGNSGGSTSTGILVFAKGGTGSNYAAGWTLTGNYAGSFALLDSVNGGGITIPASPTSNATVISGPLSIGGGSAATSTSTMTINRNAVAGLTFGLDISADGYVYFNQGYPTNDGFKWSTGGTNRMTLIAGALSILTVGKGLQVKEGSNAKQGTATLVNGTLAVANTSITATSRIFVQATAVNASTTIGSLRVISQTAGTGFTVTSMSAVGATSAGDQSSFIYEIFEPA